MVERIFICTQDWKVPMMKSLLGDYLVEVEGPTEYDPAYLLKADIPVYDNDRIRSGIIQIGKLLRE